MKIIRSLFALALFVLPPCAYEGSSAGGETVCDTQPELCAP